MWQAGHVRDRLRGQHPGLEVVIIGVKTRADRFLDASLASLGGKGVFVKELEQALLDGSADIAVHSMKDVTIDLPDTLILPVILEREDVRDCLVANNHQQLDELPPHARVGTSSLRRRCQLQALRPDLAILDIRGNVGTRLQKLDGGDYDGLVLAAAGVKRLGLDPRIREYIEPGVILPAVGQGAMGIEARADNLEALELIMPLNDVTTHQCVIAERSLSRRLYGGCHVPVAAHAGIVDGKLSMNALVGRLDGSEIVRASINGPREEAVSLGDELGRRLLDMGAARILRELMDESDD
jgi:hydroxymethylbilane synthase